MALQLVVVAGPDKGREFTLSVGPNLMLGRSNQARYQLTDPRVSRSHCQVLLEDDTVTLICQGGSGGTQVNGKPVQKRVLQLGDLLEIGDTQLRLVVGDLPGDVAQEPRRPAAALAGKADNLESLAGQTLAHYHLTTVIGKGRSGVVFHATDTKDDKPVALKVLEPQFAQDEQAVQRFIRGMKTVLPLSHPNLVRVYGAGRVGNHCWVAMEYVAGENLQQVIDRIGVAGMLDWKHAFRAALHVGRALEYAHGQQILHRNVTPTNILRELTTKEVKLGDLMLAKALEGPLAQQITAAGQLVGDVLYMSPEKTRGTSDLDARSDLYGLGATVYALLTGRPPCGGATLVEKITRIRQVEPEKPSKFQMGIPGKFEGVVMKLLKKDPGERFQDASELVEELERIGRFSGAPLD
jgi:serine/threonine protein kinase